MKNKLLNIFGVLIASVFIALLTFRTAQASNYNTSEIQGYVFKNAHGVIKINQASGHGNQQYNGVEVQYGTPVLKDGYVLQEYSGSTNYSDQDYNETNTVITADTAFQGTKGVLQMNQTSGSYNGSSNRLILHVSPSVR